MACSERGQEAHSIHLTEGFLRALICSSHRRLLGNTTEFSGAGLVTCSQKFRVYTVGPEIKSQVPFFQLCSASANAQCAQFCTGTVKSAPLTPSF